MRKKKRWIQFLAVLSSSQYFNQYVKYIVIDNLIREHVEAATYVKM